MIEIELWNLEDFTGILARRTTGVLFSNQTGGTACSHPQIEGIYVPLPLYKVPSCLDDLWGIEYDKELTQKAIEQMDAVEDFEPAHETKLQLSEAWVPVKIKASTRHPQLIPFIGEEVILTYQNSD